MLKIVLNAAKWKERHRKWQKKESSTFPLAILITSFFCALLIFICPNAHSISANHTHRAKHGLSDLWLIRFELNGFYTAVCRCIGFVAFEKCTLENKIDFNVGSIPLFYRVYLKAIIIKEANSPKQMIGISAGLNRDEITMYLKHGRKKIKLLISNQHTHTLTGCEI